MENELLVDEELTRIKIRQWLNEEQEGDKKRIWKVINAPIFLWLVSSVVFSGILFCTSLITDHISAKRDLQNRLTNLRVELSYRMDPVVLDALYTEDENGISVGFSVIETFCATPKFNALSSPSKETNNTYSFSPTVDVGLSQRERQILNARFVFPEFEGRSIFSLLWELESITTNDSERQSVISVTKAINTMRTKAINKALVSRDLSISPINTLMAAWQNGNWTGS